MMHIKKCAENVFLHCLFVLGGGGNLCADFLFDHFPSTVELVGGGRGVLFLRTTSPVRDMALFSIVLFKSV